tara:strand:- start:1156 stop:1935 length:780 start_codon:yes stop_codon:yes gene_type:complete
MALQRETSHSFERAFERDPSHHVAPSWSNTYSIETDGSDDYVSCATGTDINFIHNGASLAYWVNFDSAMSLHGIGVSTSSKAFYMGIYSAGYTYAGVPNGGASYGAISPGLSTGEWNHLALTVASGGTIKTYANGALISTNTYTPDASKSPPSNFFLGGMNSHATGGITLNNTVDGHVDEVGIWTEELDADAITAIYNSGEPTDLTVDDGNYDNSDTLWAYWRCGDNDGGTGSTITDQGSGANNGTLVGGTSFTTDVPS